MTDEKELEKLRNISIKRILGRQEDGRRIQILCPNPLHRERTPSFTIFEDNHYNCFGCGINGRGAIDFLLALGATFQEAVKELSTV